jgi:hypothetical protein
VSNYNYERFDAYVSNGEDEREFGAFPNMLHVGERAPDGKLQLLDGERVSLSHGDRVCAGGADLGRARPRRPSVDVATSAYSVPAGSFGAGTAACSNRSETRLRTRMPCTKTTAPPSQPPVVRSTKPTTVSANAPLLTVPFV